MNSDKHWEGDNWFTCKELGLIYQRLKPNTLHYRLDRAKDRGLLDALCTPTGRRTLVNLTPQLHWLLAAPLHRGINKGKYQNTKPTNRSRDGYFKGNNDNSKTSNKHGGSALTANRTRLHAA